MSSDAWFYTAFNDSIYTDDASDFGPFGNDTGADIFASWASRHPHKEANYTVRDVLRETWDAHFVIDKSADTDEAIIGAGFTLLRLTGRIDEEGRGLVLDALRRAARRTGDPEGAYRKMLADLSHVQGDVPSAGAASDATWLRIFTGGGDARLDQWCREVEQQLGHIEELRSWWASVDAETLDFCPDFFSLRNYVDISRYDESLVAHAGDRRLGKISKNLIGDVVTENTGPSPSLVSDPEVTKILTRLIRLVLAEVGQRAGAPAPLDRF